MSFVDQFEVELSGGSPWGFTLQGGLDHRSPMRIGRVTAGGRAASGGLVAGDYILTINGQSTKELKHLQAQQIIKNSKTAILLECTKVRPGIMSPAVTMNAPPPSFSFPSGMAKTTPIKAKGSVSISRPAPPPTASYGHTRGGSLDTPSESTTTTISTPSPVSSPSNVEVYDVKFLGMQCHECLSDQTTPLPSQSFLANGDSGIMEDSISTLADAEQCNTTKISPPADDQQILATDNADSAIVNTDSATVNVDSVTESGTIDETVDADMNVKDAEFSEELEDVSAMVENIQQEVESIAPHVPEGEASGAPADPGQDTSPPPVSNEPKRRRSKQNSFTKRELVDIISQAAEARSRRENSMSGSTCSDEGVSQPAVPKQAPPTVITTTPPAPIAAPVQDPPFIKPTLAKKDDTAPLSTKDPGWYQQMFKTFTNTVQESFPLANQSSDQASDTPTYVYDERGLKVRSSSISKAEEAQELRKKADSPEAPVYVYDDRGLRVPVRSASHIRSDSTPAVMVGAQHEPVPKGPKYMSASGGSSKENILAESKRTTSYKTAHYSTGSSRNYWKQKDQEHIEFDQQRRRSQEQLFHRRHSSSDFTAKMTAMHPLLQQEMGETETSDTNAAPEETQKVFDRIDASKLQGALQNASMLNSLEQEGVPSHLLPALAQEQQAAAAAKEEKKPLKPPPGPKAQATFTFQGKNDKELSFNKGDFIDVLHTVDDNWLEGSIVGKTGIFPTNYVKVLTQSQYMELMAPTPPTPVLQAKALFDFSGETARELQFKKDDVIIIDKKVDANWYSGRLGDEKGIFPVTYVEIMEQ